MDVSSQVLKVQVEKLRDRVEFDSPRKFSCDQKIPNIGKNESSLPGNRTPPPREQNVLH